MLKNCQRRVSYERSRRKISSTDSKVKKNFQETIIDPQSVSFFFFLIFNTVNECVKAGVKNNDGQFIC